MIRWSLETQRKFTIIGSTERKVKIIRVSSVIGMDYSNVPQNLFETISKDVYLNVLRCHDVAKGRRNQP